MDIAVKRPILIGGLGLSASLWLLDVVHHMPMDGGTLILGAIAIGSGLWWWNKQRQVTLLPHIPQQATVERDVVDKALERTDQLIDLLLAEDAAAAAQAELYRTERDLLLDSLERQELNIAITGNKATGKTTLLNCLQSSSSLSFTDSSENMRDADLVLLMVAGDMTASELLRLETLVSNGYQVLVVLNKQDQYTPMDKAVVLDKIQHRLAERNVELVAISAKPHPIKVRRHSDSGKITESFEQPVAVLFALTQQLDKFVA